ncbi:hypothetical protein JCM10212_004512 [Sporobolomyces blumeae]
MDAFRTLTGGSNFDRKRFKSDIQHFQPQLAATAASPASQAATSLPEELDFFATPASTSANEAKKRKKRKRSIEVEPESAEIQEAEPPVDLAAAIRKHKIKLTGLDLPSPVGSLSSALSEASELEGSDQAALKTLGENWRRCGMKEPTGIQMASWGTMLANRDILACAPTGSGKTFSFVLPLLAMHPPFASSPSSSTLDASSSASIRPRSIIIEPTRELAMQVLRETRRLAQGGEWKVGVLGEEGIGSVRQGKTGKKQKGNKKGKGKAKAKVKEDGKGAEAGSDKGDADEDGDEVVEGGVAGEEGQTASELGKSAGEAEAEPYLGPLDILITTPLRLVFALKSNLVSFSSLFHLILDEADKLFELNFLEQTDEILAACKRDESMPVVRKGMFSATMPSSVEEMAKSVMAGAGGGIVRAIVGHKEAATTTITQKLSFVNTEDHKLLTLRSLIRAGEFTPPVLIFVQSISRAKELTTELLLDGLSADSIHAERTPEERDVAVREFAEGKVWALVCTDVMGRGVDFKGVKLVINYDFPQSAMSYIHRIGRTGRAGKEGRAITFFTKADAGHLKTIVNVMRQSGCEVPEWMVALPAPTQDAKKALKMRPIGRKDISRTNGAGAADDVRDRKGKKVKRERVMGGKGGVFKRREGDEAEKKDPKGRKGGKGQKRRTEQGEKADQAGEEGDRKSKKPRKGKVDLDE